MAGNLVDIVISLSRSSGIWSATYCGNSRLARQQPRYI